MKFLDLFAGIGGFRLGMEQAGHECVGYVEWDKYARKSYEAIHDTEGEWTAHDITRVTDEDIRLLSGKGIDVICGGFPCQAFSTAGRRGGFADTRGTLFFEIARIAEQVKPRLLLLENVKGLLSHDKGRTFGTILNTLDELGYDCEWQVLNSKNFGVPQNRERVFIVGHSREYSRREIFPFRRADGEVDTAIEIAADLNHYGNDQMNRVYSVEGISPTLTVPSGGGREHKIAIPVLTPDRAEKRQNGRRFKEDGDPSFTLTAQDKHGVMIRETADGFHLARNDEKKSTVQGTHVTYPEGTSHCLSTAHKPMTLVGVGHHPLSKKQEFKGYHDDVSPCLIATDYKAPKTAMFKNGEEYRIRKLTPRECFRLQGFPDSAFDKAAEVNSNSQLYKQAGNSVTVNVIHEIAKRL